MKYVLTKSTHLDLAFELSEEMSGKILFVQVKGSWEWHRNDNTWLRKNIPNWDNYGYLRVYDTLDEFIEEHFAEIL
jgi:hypothetical protein